ncbi:hypothetical protein WR25_10161 [Diploscapter pachys]|uniref:Uncharacterized protein n=1 Tax=Diploscapter pachys TaxID=2018661 RepID=A0A2A2L6M2_9BILA|nr:hypothetical protein WR25_10161 [Diploscapter pachys]
MVGVFQAQKMTSPPMSPSHLQVRSSLSVSHEDEETGKPGQQPHTPKKAIRKIDKITALSGETDMTGPPPVSATRKNRFRNGHASFRLRMLQEQHGTGFEPVR